MPQLPAVNEASNELSASDRMRLFVHGEDLLSSTSQRELGDCLGSLRDWLDVSEITVAAGTIGRLHEARYMGSGHDPEWMNLYFREGFAQVDPIVRAIVGGRRFLSRARATAESNAAVRRRSNGPTLDRFMEAARDHGRLGYGFACGVVFHNHIALCSVVTTNGRADQRAPLILRALRPILYQALTRVLLPEPVFPDLSPRERAILECLASGHNDTQIADILSISASTVRFHLGNVFDKLGARNRCHAVAIGFQSGLLQR